MILTKTTNNQYLSNYDINNNKIITKKYHKKIKSKSIIYYMEESKLKLGKLNSKKQKVKLIMDSLIDELKCVKESKLDQELTKDVCNSVALHFDKSKYKDIDKKELVVMLLKTAHELTPEEQEVISNQIDFLLNHKKIKKYSYVGRKLVFFLKWITGKLL